MIIYNRTPVGPHRAAGQAKPRRPIFVVRVQAVPLTIGQRSTEMTATAGDRRRLRPSPVDRGRAGSKHHVPTDANGVALATSLTGGNRTDVTQLRPLVKAFPTVRGRRGRPRRRPDDLYADRGYDHDTYRRAFRAQGIRPHIARRGTAHGSGLGVYRWLVDRTIAWYHGMKRRRIRLGTPRRHPRSAPRPRPPASSRSDTWRGCVQDLQVGRAPCDFAATIAAPKRNSHNATHA